jgi:hypothetical protein
LEGSEEKDGGEIEEGKWLQRRDVWRVSGGREEIWKVLKVLAGLYRNSERGDRDLTFSVELIIALNSGQDWYCSLQENRTTGWYHPFEWKLINASQGSLFEWRSGSWDFLNHQSWRSSFAVQKVRTFLVPIQKVTYDAWTNKARDFRERESQEKRIRIMTENVRIKAE